MKHEPEPVPAPRTSSPDSRCEDTAPPTSIPGRWTVPAAIAAASIAIIYCAGPGLLTAGVVSGLGALLGSPTLTAIGLVATATAVTVILRRR